MRPLTALLAMALLAASLAGCADPERYPDGVSHSSSSRSATGGPSPTRTATSTSTTAPGNQLPVGSISVALNGTNATFTLNATDPDGDDLTWELDFGDGNMTNGTSLPSLVNHTYVPSNGTGNGTGNATGNSTGNATGNLTAVFTVSDGQGNVTYNVTIAFGDGTKLTQTITGSTVGPNPTGDALACIGDDVDGNTYALDPAGPGWTYAVEPGDGTFGAYFYDGGGGFLGGGTDPAGTVPDDAVDIEVCNVTGEPMAAYTVTLTEP